MTTDRIKLLFPATMPPAMRREQINVLTAVCRAVSHKAKTSRFTTRLTDHLNRVSLDEVREHLDFPMPTSAVMRALIDFNQMSFLNVDMRGFETITLTNTLFSAIAEEWCYANGSRPFRVAREKIFAPSMEYAVQIANRRVVRAKSLLPC